MDDITLFSLFQELQGSLGASRASLQKYETFFKFAHGLITVLIGSFTVINTVIVFTDTSEIARKILMCINMLFVSGLLGNFGNRQATTKNQKENLDFVMKSLIQTKNKLGLIHPPPAAIVDSNFVGSPPEPIQFPAPPPAAGIRDIVGISSLVSDPILRTKVTTLESLLGSRLRFDLNI